MSAVKSSWHCSATRRKRTIMLMLKTECKMWCQHQASTSRFARTRKTRNVIFLFFLVDPGCESDFCLYSNGFLVCFFLVFGPLPDGPPASRPLGTENQKSKENKLNISKTQIHSQDQQEQQKCQLLFWLFWLGDSGRSSC